jgi:hypothetical protein
VKARSNRNEISPLKASLKLKPSSPNKQTFNLPSAVIRNRLQVPQKLLYACMIRKQKEETKKTHLDMEVINPIRPLLLLSFILYHLVVSLLSLLLFMTSFSRCNPYKMYTKSTNHNESEKEGKRQQRQEEMVSYMIRFQFINNF